MNNKLIVIVFVLSFIVFLVSGSGFAGNVWAASFKDENYSRYIYNATIYGWSACISLLGCCVMAGIGIAKWVRRKRVS